MFTRQTGLLDQMSPYVQTQVVEILRQVIGQCEQTLEHRGPIQLELPDHLSSGSLAQPAARTATGVKPLASLAVENRSSQYSAANDRVAGGFAIHATGVSYIETLRVGNLISDTTQTNDPAGNESARPATAARNWSHGGLPSQTGSPGWVTATIAGVGEARVWLPVSRGQDPNVTAGQQFYAVPIKGSSDWMASGLGDDAVGTIKATSLDNSQLPPGWALVPGALNAEGAYVRGTSIDLGMGGEGDKMSPAPRPVGAVSGDTKYALPGVDVNLIARRIHDHPATVTTVSGAGITIAAHKGRTEPAPTGIQIAPHGPHNHPTYTAYVRGCSPDGEDDDDGGSGDGGSGELDPQPAGLSGFPGNIQVTLGGTWNDMRGAGLESGTAITLKSVDGGGTWTEDGTGTPNDATNRLQFSPGVGGSLEQVAIAAADSGVWVDLGGCALDSSESPDGLYEFREVWSGVNDEVFDYLASIAFGDPDMGPSYNPDVFSSLQSAGDDSGGGDDGSDDDAYGGSCNTIITSYGPDNGVWEHAVIEPNQGEGTGHTHALPPLEHKVQDHGHDHTVASLGHYGKGTMENQDIPLLPLAVSLKFIQRVDNSA